MPAAAEKRLRKRKRKSRLPSVTLDPAVESPARTEKDEAPASRAVPRLRISIHRPPIRHLVNLSGALLVSAAVLYVSFFPVAGLPALGPAFNPATGLILGTR